MPTSYLSFDIKVLIRKSLDPSMDQKLIEKALFELHAHDPLFGMYVDTHGNPIKHSTWKVDAVIKSIQEVSKEFPSVVFRLDTLGLTVDSLKRYYISETSVNLVEPEVNVVWDKYEV